MAMVARVEEPAALSWADGLKVDERRLQEYMHSKQHTLLLKGVAQTMKHTLEPLATTNAADGFVHIGDSLMLRNAGTEGLLLADVADTVDVSDGSRTELTGNSLSTAQIIMACQRSVFTISRTNEKDSFEDDPYLHYGQTVRIGTANLQRSADLPCERPRYLFCSTLAGAGACEEEGETLVCLYARAAPGTLWKVQKPGRKGTKARAATGDGDVVALGEPFNLVSVATGRLFLSDRTVRMNHYGNEFRVFGKAASATATAVAAVDSTGGAMPLGSSSSPEAGVWAFVNSDWAEDLIDYTRRSAEDKADRTAGGSRPSTEPGSRSPDTTADKRQSPAPVEALDVGEMLRNPLYRAEVELKAINGAGVFAALMRIYTILRRSGLHAVRKLRHMCIQNDTEGYGWMPAFVFEGVLSWVAIRLTSDELNQMAAFLGNGGETDEAHIIIDYRKFFALMSPALSESEVRDGVVRDAYEKLQSLSPGGVVEVSILQRHWNPHCHPEVQAGNLLRSEAVDEFLRQWQLDNSDGLVSLEEFSDYYSDIHMVIENDEIFTEIVRLGWNL